MRSGRLRRNRALFPLLIALGAIVVLNGASWWAFRVSTREIQENFRRNLISFSQFLARQIEIAYRVELETALDVLEKSEEDFPTFESGQGWGVDFEEWMHNLPAGFLRDLASTQPVDPIFHDLYLLGSRGELLLTWSGEWIADASSGASEGRWRIHPLLIGDRDAILSAIGESETTVTSEEVAARGFFATCFSPIRFGGEARGAVGVRADILFADRLEGIRRGLLLAALVGSLLIVGLATMLHRSLGQLDAARSRMAHRERLAQLGQMASVVAHEIRNPLGIIEQTADLVRRKYSPDAKDPLLGYISEEVDRLNRLVARFLEFARPAESADTFASERTCDLADRVAEVHSLLLPEAGKRGIVFTVDLPEGLPNARGIDDERAKQVLLNLVLNAFDATPDGKEVEIGLRREGGDLVLRVRDEGRGMSPEELRRVIDPFFTTKEKGSGLGLALVAKVVEEAGGRLEFQSQPGQGCTVAISFKCLS